MIFALAIFLEAHEKGFDLIPSRGTPFPICCDSHEAAPNRICSIFSKVVGPVAGGPCQWQIAESVAAETRELV